MASYVLIVMPLFCVVRFAARMHGIDGVGLSTCCRLCVRGSDSQPCHESRSHEYHSACRFACDIEQAIADLAYRAG